MGDLDVQINNSWLFLQMLENNASIPFDPVYTAKVIRRFSEACNSDQTLISKPLMIHTGGLQGRRSIAHLLDNINGVEHQD